MDNMIHPEIKQASEFVLEAWVEMQEDYELHTCWKDDRPHIYDTVYNMCRPFPDITRAMIKELLEEVEEVDCISSACDAGIMSIGLLVAPPPPKGDQTDDLRNM